MVFDGQRLKAVRKKFGLTQEEMADVLGLKQGSYSDIERGKTKEISGGTKKILENEYGVNIDYLYWKSESMSIDDAKFFAEQSTQSVVNEEAPTYFTKDANYWRGAAETYKEQLGEERKLVLDITTQMSEIIRTLGEKIK